MTTFHKLYPASSKFVFAFILSVSTMVSQPSSEIFETKEQYCKYVKKQYGIPIDDIHYMVRNDSLNFNIGEFDIMTFIYRDSLTSIRKVSDFLSVQCSPDALMKKVTAESIRMTMDQSPNLKNLKIRNMMSGHIINEEKYIIYAFSIRFKDFANLYYSQFSKLDKKLGYKAVLVSIDGAYIKDIKDIDKTPVFIRNDH